MGILKVFLDVASTLQADPNLATNPILDGLFPIGDRFAYIGNRKGLRGFAVKWMQTVRDKILELNAADENRLAADPVLGKLARQIRSNPHPADSSGMLQTVYGKNWETNSGAYPDFILAEEGGPQLGDGAILELKDSRGDQIASFNSTLPTRHKSLREALRVTGVKSPSISAQLYDLPRSLGGDYMERQRICFYLVRTRGHDSATVRLSLVEGSFFETLPTQELLTKTWAQILAQVGMDESERLALTSHLSELEQSDIAKSREIEHASIKPRFRIMAEAHAEGNPHRYDEIGPRTLNLILKQEETVKLDLLNSLFAAEGIQLDSLEKSGDTRQINLRHNGQSMALGAFAIRHRRNGIHLVIQYHLPPAGATKESRKRTRPRKLRESQPPLIYETSE